MDNKKCLRCAGIMQSIGTEKIQLGQTSLITSNWSNIFAGSLKVSIHICRDCGKVEFYSNYLKENSDALPQKSCPNCGSIHDFDYPKCPDCKYKY